MSNVVKRIITGAVYAVVFIGLVVMKWLIPDNWGALGFDALLCAISVIGCIEVLNAFGNVTYIQKAVTVAFCSATVPLFAVTQITMHLGVISLCCLACIFAFVLAAINVFNFGESTIRGSMLCIFTMLYCGILPCAFTAVNHLSENSMAAVLILVICVPLTDSGAYIIGSLLKKWVPYKLAPKLSPNKTVIGFLGGLLGGIIGAVAACFIDFGLGKVRGASFAYDGSLPIIVVFILVGFITSVFAQLGDLFESAIKRECNIKDIGNILPGHGGVMDRFDSTLFGGIVISLFFAIIL